MNKESKNRIEQILESLDSSQKISAPDFFYTRLRARLQKEQEKTKTSIIRLRPAYALIALAIVLIINISVILEGEKTTETTINDNETAQSIAAEYSLNDNGNVYDLTMGQ